MEASRLMEEVIDSPASEIIPFAEEEKRIKLTRLFAAPLATLSLDEQVEALAVLKRVDSWLNSSAKKAPGRLKTLTESIRGLMSDLRSDRIAAGTMKAGETTSITHAGVELSLTGGAEIKTPNAARIEALAASLGSDDAYNVTHRVDVDRLFELNREGVVSNDVIATVVQTTRAPSLEKLVALKTLGRISDADLESVYDVTTAPLALRVG